jgi:hypothetical protein
MQPGPSLINMKAKCLRIVSNVMFSSTTRKAKKWKKAIRINEFAGDCADDDGTVEGAVPAVGPRW